MIGFCVWLVVVGLNIFGEILCFFIGFSFLVEWNCNFLFGVVVVKGEDVIMVLFEGGLFWDDMVVEGWGNVDMVGDGWGVGRKKDDVRWVGG